MHGSSESESDASDVSTSETVFFTTHAGLFSNEDFLGGKCKYLPKKPSIFP
jgi:hypothetical protein